MSHLFRDVFIVLLFFCFSCSKNALPLVDYNRSNTQIVEQEYGHVFSLREIKEYKGDHTFLGNKVG